MLTMSRMFYISLVLVLCAGLGLELVTLSRARQELRVVTGANDFLRKTLGEMTIAITEKEKQIDRLSQLPCGATPMAKEYEVAGAGQTKLERQR